MVDREAVGEWDGRVGFVTGGGSGIGLAVVQRLASYGVRTMAFDLQPAPPALAGFAEVDYIVGNATDEPAVASAMDRLFHRTGRLDFLVNAVGVLWRDRDRSVLETSQETWDEVLRINLGSMAVACRRAVPLMRRGHGGAMVHLSSIGALRGDPTPQDGYQASKGAMLSLSKSLAVQLGPEGIRSNVVLPGPTRTPMQAHWATDPVGQAAMAARVPLGRWAEPGEVAAACVFLLSSAASFITGAELVVDGGMAARW